MKVTLIPPRMLTYDRVARATLRHVESVLAEVEDDRKLAARIGEVLIRYPGVRARVSPVVRGSSPQQN